MAAVRVVKSKLTKGWRVKSGTRFVGPVYRLKSGAQKAARRIRKRKRR